MGQTGISSEGGSLRRLATLGLALSVAGLMACGGQADSAGTAVAAEPTAQGGDAATASAAEDDDRMDAPGWELPDLDGTLIASSRYAGKIIVMDFWATWCPPCLFQIPILNTIQTKHEGAGVVVIGVAVDAEGAEVVKPYAEENGIEYQLVIGDESLARKFGAPGFPALAVVSADGKIDSMHVGLIEEADLDAAIAKAAGS